MNKILFISTVNISMRNLVKVEIMNKYDEIQCKLIGRIDEILNDFQDFEKTYVNNNGDIIIRKKNTVKKNKDYSILTNIFKEIIKNDLKKNRV